MYLVSSQAIPMVDVQIDFDAGSRRDPSSQAGLASVTAGMFDKGVLARGADRHWMKTPSAKPGPTSVPPLARMPAVTA